MTQAQVKEALNLKGISFRKANGEFRVNLMGIEGSEATAYYTDDLEDAHMTGLCMAQHRDAQHAAKV